MKGNEIEALESFIDYCDSMKVEVAEESSSIKESLIEMAIVAAITSGICAVKRLNELADKKREIKNHKDEQKKIDEEFDRLYEEWKKETKPDIKLTDKVGKAIQKDLVAFLKKLSKSPQLNKPNSTMKKALEIKADSDFGDYGVQITPYQSGMIDWDDEENNDWYYEMQSAGEKYIGTKYPFEINFYKFNVHTGDGDEGGIYIEI